MEAEKILNIIGKQWASSKDIQIIGSVGINKAYEIRKEIATELETQGYNLPHNLVPMEKVVDYFKININYLKKVSHTPTKERDTSK